MILYSLAVVLVSMKFNLQICKQLVEEIFRESIFMAFVRRLNALMKTAQTRRFAHGFAKFC